MVTSASKVPAAPPKQVLTCLESNPKVLSREAMNDALVKFCSDAAKQGSQDPNSGSLVRTYNDDKDTAVSLSMDWPIGKDIRLNMEQKCRENMAKIMDSKNHLYLAKEKDSANLEFPDCDTNGGDKHGGQILDGDVLYHINPMSELHPVQRCEVETKKAGVYAEIYGKSWNLTLLDKNGNGNGLHDELLGCAGGIKLPVWDYYTGDKLTADETKQGWQFHASAKVWAGKAGCVGRAMASAGGPSGSVCCTKGKC